MISYQSGKNIVSRSVSLVLDATVVSKDEISDVDISEDVFHKAGDFTKVDPIHYARGEVQIVEKDNQIFIEFQEDFSVADGPDLYIHLSGEQEYGNAKQGSIENTLNLGKITSKNGKQTYVVTKEEWEQYNHSILIWCRAFGVHFSHAILQ